MSEDDVIRIDSMKAAVVSDAADTDQLHQLGYPQLLHRGLTGFRNMGVSFSIICIIGGVALTYSIGMADGGPADLFWGFVLVSGLILALGAAMAEVCSSYPTSGGLYYWSAKLAKRNAAAWAWFTGWFNVLGQIAGTAGASFGASFFIVSFGVLEGWWSYTTKNVVLAYIIATVVLGLVVTFGRKLVGFIGGLSVWWHTVFALVMIGALIFAPAHHQTASVALTHFVNGTTFHWPIYAALLGLLVGAETYTGYDASAHLTEETKQPGLAAPRAMVRAIAIAAVLGILLIGSLNFAIQNYATESVGAKTGNAVGDILVDAVGVGFGKVLVAAIAIALLICVNGNLTSNSRMIYAFSRDFARVDDGRPHPVSRKLSEVHTGSRVPRYAVWVAVLGACVLGVLNLWSTVAFNAAITINVIGLYTAYAIPVFLRLRQGDNFQRGPWHLGRWSSLVGWIAVGWVVAADILFVLPSTNPVFATATFPYTLPVFVVVIGGAALWWKLSAHKWFVGPRSLGTPEELAAIEQRLDESETAAAPVAG
ncbi:amino acid permease [Actinospica sp.]|jgi:amino acid transporter|uniref:amino acid permease n=1 Tax=Actinospica sp. TaxID=1872142 RepID=UPI002BB8F660|nr:amino acid permease [Actinospica sp.]HWG26901.1 amino acid permease [Actinospica sp.]